MVACLEFANEPLKPVSVAASGSLGCGLENRLLEGSCLVDAWWTHFGQVCVKSKRLVPSLDWRSELGIFFAMVLGRRVPIFCPELGLRVGAEFGAKGSAQFITLKGFKG